VEFERKEAADTHFTSTGFFLEADDSSESKTVNKAINQLPIRWFGEVRYLLNVTFADSADHNS
jgi:hypothetical protein